MSDRGIYGDGRVKQGAKAIVSQTMSSYGGSGRLSSACFTGDEHDTEFQEDPEENDVSVPRKTRVPQQKYLPVTSNRSASASIAPRAGARLMEPRAFPTVFVSI